MESQLIDGWYHAKSFGDLTVWCKALLRNRHLHALALLVILFSVHFGTVWAQGIDDARRCFQETKADLRIHYCTRAIHSRRLSDTDLAITFNNRGIACWGKREYDRAIRDYHQSIRLNPNFVEAFNQRGFTYWEKKEYERAIQDFNQAIRIEPNYADALNYRGLTKFDSGQFLAAVPDFDKAAQLVPSKSYSVIWRYLAQSRAGQNGRDTLASSASRLELKQWPGPVVSMYRGKITRRALLEAALDSDPAKQRERQCEAYFYVGE